MWLLICWSLEVYMIVNFRIHEISRDTHKLTWITTLIYKKNKKQKTITCTNKQVGGHKDRKPFHYMMTIHKNAGVLLEKATKKL